MCDDENAQLYRRDVVGSAFQLGGDHSVKRRETCTGEARPPLFRRLSKDDRKAQARLLGIPRPKSASGSITGLSTVETIENESLETIETVNDDTNTTLRQPPSQSTLPAWASLSPGNFSWSDEEDEDLGVYATAGTKQRSYDLAEESDSEEEGEQDVAPAMDVSEAEAPSHTNPASQANTPTNFTLDVDDIECQLLEDPDAFKAYIKDLNTKLQLLISSTNSAEQTAKEVLEQAEDTNRKRGGEQTTTETELRKQIAEKEADFEQFKEDLHEKYSSKYDTAIAAKDTTIESLRAKIAEQQIVIEHNRNSNTDFHNKKVADAVKTAEEKLHYDYSIYNSDLKAEYTELKTAWKTLKEEREHILTRLRNSEEKLREARAFIEDYDTAYADLRSDKERLEAQFGAERRNLTHLELMHEELESAKESELAAAHQKHQEEMAGTHQKYQEEMAGIHVAKEKEITAVRGEMKDLQDEIDFKDEQLQQLADLTLSEVELKEKVQDLEAQIVEKDQQSELHAKLEEEKNTATTERDELQAQLSTLKEQLAAQAIDQTDQLAACELDMQTLQAQFIEVQSKRNDELTINFIQAEELAALKVENKKLQDELKQARAKEFATTSAMHVPRSEQMQNLKSSVTKMRTALENRPAPYVSKYMRKIEERKRAEHAGIVAVGLQHW